MSQAKPDYVVALVAGKNAYLYVNGEFCSSFDQKNDSEDEFDTLAQDMAEMYNTEAQYINVSDTQIQSIFGPGKVDMFKLDWAMAVFAIKSLNIQTIVVEPMDLHESLARDLEAGASADIWFDASQFGDTRNRMLIEKVKSAMEVAATELRNASASARR